MEENINARRLAIEALYDIIYKNNFSNEIINSNITKLEDVDKNFFRQIIYGVLENLYYIDYIIQKSSSIKLRKIDKKILLILRIAVYELIFLNSKNYATINEAVKNTKKINYKSKNFVNGILRDIDRNLEKYMKLDIDDEIEKISIKYSFNRDIVEYIKNNYEDYEEIIKNLNQKPSFYIRVNTTQIQKNNFLEIIKNKGFEVEESKISKNSFKIKNPGNITNLKEFKNGYFTIQDQASSLVSEILNPKSGTKILDLCAAPGSKSVHIAQLTNDESFIISNDISKGKLYKIQENYDRLRFKNYRITNYDATEEIEEFRNQFDYILVDAPCSGIGVIKRKPEIKLNRTIEDIKELSKIQKNILNRAYDYLKTGGVLVYSTCTIGPYENENVIRDFLEKHKDIFIEKINDKDFIELLPSVDNDGFFICKMYKK